MGVQLALLLLLGGCAKIDEGRGPVSSSNYEDEYPAAFCAMWAECNPDKLMDLYDGQVLQCEEDLADDVASQVERGCVYDDAAAGECLDQLDTMGCADWEEGEDNICGDVFDC
jgi:hypothetical protein